MILEVQHETKFEYSEFASEALTELRMEPASDGEQSLHSFHLAVSPQTETFRYHDGFGNRVHHFNVLAPHRAVRILAASIVETGRASADLERSNARWPVPEEHVALDVVDFLQFRGSVRATPGRLAPLLDALRPLPGMRATELIQRVSRYINGHFRYARDVTLANSPVDEILEKGKGVCQDFAHLMIAVLRSFGVPARYVSGYIHRPNEESQSHAWCEAWVSDLGWVGIDPTNDRLVDERFVKVAVGRDFTDVPPNKGVCRTRGEETIFVRVETRALDRLPSLSWQDQLPPLHVPLTAIVPRSNPAPTHEEEVHQQQ